MLFPRVVVFEEETIIGDVSITSFDEAVDIVLDRVVRGPGDFWEIQDIRWEVIAAFNIPQRDIPRKEFSL